MSVEITGAIIVSIIALCFSVYNNTKVNKRTDVKDVEAKVKEKVRHDTQVDMKLDEINRGVTDIKYNVSSLTNDVKKLGERLTIAERATDKAHSRIDALEEVVKMSRGGGSDGIE